MAYVWREFSKNKPATLLVSVEEKEKVRAIIFKLLQREQLGEEMNSLKFEKKKQQNSTNSCQKHNR